MTTIDSDSPWLAHLHPLFFSSKNLSWTLWMVKHPKWYYMQIKQKPSYFFGTVCALSIPNSTLLNLSIVSLLILLYFILFSNVSFCILVHAYTLCFIGSPCCSISYNYISIWPYHIVIHLLQIFLFNNTTQLRVLIHVPADLKKKLDSLFV